MKRINFLVGVALALGGVVRGLLGSRMLSAQDNLKGGAVLQRTDLKGAPGWEATPVLRTLPPGAESGKHTQSGAEIVYPVTAVAAPNTRRKAPIPPKRIGPNINRTSGAE